MTKVQKVLLFIATRTMFGISTTPLQLGEEFENDFETEILSLVRNGLLEKSWRYQCTLTHLGREKSSRLLYESALNRANNSPKKTPQMTG
jgi:hypothetical protein